MILIMNARVVTELEAFRILFDPRAVHVGGGGSNDSHGSVVVVAEGDRESLDRAITLIESIKGEVALRPRQSLCTNCLPTVLIANDAGVSRDARHCMYQGTPEEALPSYMRETG